MTKSEFVDQVADRAGLSKKDAGDAVDAMLETIEGALRRGSDVTFSGFGKFSVSQRSAREGRNPATGEKIQIAASRVPKFTAGAALNLKLGDPILLLGTGPGDIIGEHWDVRTLTAVTPDAAAFCSVRSERTPHADVRMALLRPALARAREPSGSQHAGSRPADAGCRE